MLAALLVLDLRGTSIDMTLVAGLVLAAGAVAGDAVAVVVHMRRRLRERAVPGEARSASSSIVTAALEVRGPLLFALVIVAAAAAPLLVVGGVTGAFLEPILVSYGLALLAATGSR